MKDFRLLLFGELMDAIKAMHDADLLLLAERQMNAPDENNLKIYQHDKDYAAGRLNAVLHIAKKQEHYMHLHDRFMKIVPYMFERLGREYFKKGKKYYVVKTVIYDNLTATVTMEPPVWVNSLYPPDSEFTKVEHADIYRDYFDVYGAAVEWMEMQEHDNQAMIQK